MKCILCRKRKAKRYCPAKRGSICAICCGEKRGVEIECPLDCPFYIDGQKYQQEKVSRQRLRKEGVGSFIKRAELYKKAPHFFAEIELAFVNVFRTKKDLKNHDLTEALELVLKTLETEQKGVLYDYRSENSFANEIADQVIKIIRKNKDSVEFGRDRISINYASEIIKEFQKEANFYIEKESNPQSYFIHILRHHPKKSGPHQDSGRIIIAS